MKSRNTEFHLLVRLSLCGLMMIHPSGGQTPRASNVMLSPRDDIQSAVTANPEGTSFFLSPGVYRMQRVSPKNYDAFIGQDGVVLNGSQLISFQRDAQRANVWVAQVKMSNWVHGECQTAHPLCAYTQDLFIDNVLQFPAGKFEELKPGFWYADRTRGEVYISIDPRGHAIELSTLGTAFNANKSIGVRISRLTVEKYASAAQQGAIGGDRTGVSWTVDHVEVRWNHGAGIELGSESEIAHSFIHHNGQLGICFVGVNDRAHDNEISWNNYAGFRPDSEAGGGKFLQTKNLVLRSNYVHDNAGTGLWTDTNAEGTIYERNTIVNNANQGIQHESSYDAIIHNNVIKGNGNNKTIGPWNAQIMLQSSSHVEVSENTIEVPAGGGNGIILINENRGSGNLGPFVAAYNRIHDNTIIYSSRNGYSGLANNIDADTSAAVGNSFDANHYKLQIGSENDYHWQWIDSKNWKEMRAEGQEALGDCCK